jgi:hypothetical protein
MLLKPKITVITELYYVTYDGRKFRTLREAEEYEVFLKAEYLKQKADLKLWATKQSKTKSLARKTKWSVINCNEHSILQMKIHSNYRHIKNLETSIAYAERIYKHAIKQAKLGATI